MHHASRTSKGCSCPLSAATCTFPGLQMASTHAHTHTHSLDATMSGPLEIVCVCVCALIMCVSGGDSIPADAMGTMREEKV